MWFSWPANDIPTQKLRGRAARPRPLGSRATVRPLAASLWVLLAAMTASACGGSADGTATQTAVAPPVPTTTVTAPAPPTVYRTKLERALAQAFETALLATPAAPTESQVPPKVNLLPRHPPTVCRRRQAAVYTCSLTYQLPAAPRPVRVIYAVRRRNTCFTATAAAVAPDSTLHRLRNC